MPMPFKLRNRSLQRLQISQEAAQPLLISLDQCCINEQDLSGVSRHAMPLPGRLKYFERTAREQLTSFRDVPGPPGAAVSRTVHVVLQPPTVGGCPALHGAL